MPQTSVTSPVPPHPAIAGLVRVFGDPRWRTDTEVTALCFPSPETVCTVEESGLLRVWDASTGCLRTWRFLSNLETRWKFTGDARWLASAGSELCLWNVRDGELLAVHAQPAWVTALAFRGDGLAEPEQMILALGDDEGTIRILESGGERLLRMLTGHTDSIIALAFSPDGARLASAGEDRVVRLWELPTGRCLAELAGHTDRIIDLAWHPRGQDLASASWDGSVRVWDTSTNQVAGLMQVPEAQMQALAICRDGRAVAATDSRAAVRVWDWATRTPGEVFDTGSAELTCLCYNPEGTVLAAAGTDCLVQVLGNGRSPQRGRIIPSVLSAFRRNWNQLTLAPAGDTLAELGDQTRVRVWGPDAGPSWLQPPGEVLLHSVAWSPDGRWLASGGSDGRVLLWDARSHDLVATLDHEEYSDPVTALLFSPDSSLLYAASAASTALHVWQVPAGESAWCLSDALDNCAVEALACTPDGRFLAAAGIDWMETGGTSGVVQVWKLPAWEVALTIEDGATAAAVHPDGRRLAVPLLNNTIQVWDFVEKRLRLELAGPRGTVTGLAFSPDGRVLASGGDDRVLRLWDDVTGHLRAWVDLDSEIKSLAFAPDGRFLYTANANLAVYQFEVARLLP